MQEYNVNDFVFYSGLVLLHTKFDFSSRFDQVIFLRTDRFKTTLVILVIDVQEFKPKLIVELERYTPWDMIVIGLVEGKICRFFRAAGTRRFFSCDIEDMKTWFEFFSEKN